MTYPETWREVIKGWRDNQTKDTLTSSVDLMNHFHAKQIQTRISYGP